MRLLRRIAREQRGMMAVTVGLLFPVLLGFGVLAVDVGNWYVHKRELQIQADAAALAGADAFNYPCDDAAITAAAQSYAGRDHNVFSNVHPQPPVINQPNFDGQSKPGDSGLTGSPCADKAVDVKMTETNVPWIFGTLSTPFINAQARVSIFQQTTANNVEALAVANSAPVAAEAYFVNEDNNDAIIASEPLSDMGPDPSAPGQEMWGNPSGMQVAINATKGSTANIGVVIALSGNKGDTTCGHPYVQCFDQSSTTGPSLLHIQGWSAAGTPSLTAPLARSAALSTPAGSTCSDAYYSNTTTTCTETISAWVDYGSTNTKGVTVKPVVAGSTESALTPGTTSGNAVQWTGTISLKQAGANQIDLLVACTKGTGAACGSTAATSATISNVQRPYAAGTASGPITGAWVSGNGGASQDANSFEVCEAQDNYTCTQNLSVTIDVAGSLENTQHYADPTYSIRIGTSQGDVVGCGANASPSASQYRQNLGQGCTGPFVLNSSDSTCTAAGTSPYDCVMLVNGVKNGPFQQGLSDRIVNSPPAGDHYYCKNNWTNNNNGGVPNIPADDSRMITVFVMPYGSTDASGSPLLASGYVPIKDLAVFYVTGFAGDPCSSDDPAPPNAGNAWLVGHFIKRFEPNNNGGSSGTPCDFGSLDPCVAVMTK